MSGIRTKISRKFDANEFSDVVLVVKGKKFHVSKMYLASHSPVLKSMLLGKFEESQKSEVELKDIDPWDFQNFLDLIHGDAVVDDDTVEGILQLADMYDSKTALFRCQDFLIETSKQSLDQKFRLALKYKLDELLKKFLSDVKTSRDIRDVVPYNHSELDTSIWKLLLDKSLELLVQKEYILANK